MVKNLDINAEMVTVDFKAAEPSLFELARIKNYPEAGLAVAVNQQVIPRDKWNETLLTEEDKIVVIKAACGG